MIRAGRKPASKQQSPQKAAPSANVNVTASLTQLNDSSQPIEDPLAVQAAMEYERDRREVLQKLEQEHYQHASTKASESSMASLLNEPYCPPPMVFEKKAVAAPESAYVRKASSLKQSSVAAGRQQAQTVQIVKEAMA